MNVRPLVLIGIFIAGAAGLVLIVAGAAGSGPPITISDDVLESIETPVVVQGLEFAHVRDFLASIPDPKNLFASGKPSPLPGIHHLGVRHFRRECAVPGIIEIVRGDETVGLFQASAELIPIDATHFVLYRAWHEPEVVVICVDATKLAPLDLPDPIARAEAMRDGESSFFAIDSSACTEIRIPRDLEPGRNTVLIPDGARPIRELFVFFPSTREEASNQVHVMQIDPGLDRVTVIAPVRNAFGEFDDAQGAARLVRDPTTNRIVGDGLRLRPFVLSHDLRRVERWLE